MKNQIEQIADRAVLLSGSMNHGEACFAACREFGVESSELSNVASIVSTVITSREINAPISDETRLRWAAEEKEAKAQYEFVTRWAKATGRTGKKGKQSRQCHIRKLAKHGLNSEYAKKMASEAGIEI